MNRVNLLDCTLRDGGYVNNFNFYKKPIKSIISKLSQSSIEIIECGFLKSNAFNKDKSLFGSVEAISDYLPVSHGNNMYVAMIAYGDISLDEISACDGNSITGIRLTFHENQIDEAFDFANGLSKKGYKVFIQPVGTAFYTDKMLLELIERVNNFNPFAFYIVDTLGTMYPNDLLRMFYLVDNNLKSDIKVGFHSHNNLQLSFSNAQELISIDSKREIIIDSSIFGMGRGAGNLCTELITRYINENIEDKYDLIPLLEIMDEYIMPIYSVHPWGYSAPYYIAAINNCHPNYATFLINKQTLRIRDINSIIKSIPLENKHLYDSNVINSLYTDYLSHSVDDSAVIRNLSEICRGRNVLILAPGKSISTYSEKIQKYISDNDPLVFSINYVPEKYRCDKIFISNLKRFKNVEDAVSRIGSKLICTSNIAVDLDADTVNYSDYLIDNPDIMDNAGLMLINLLKKCGVNNFALAGYDGFDYSNSKNYFDERMINNIASEQQEKNNSAIIEFFKKLRKTTTVSFITPTLYDSEG